MNNFLRNGGWHSCGSFYRIEGQTEAAQLVANVVDADRDGVDVLYEIRSATGTRKYSNKSSAVRAWKKLNIPRPSHRAP